jgi:hypothetical protein
VENPLPENVTDELDQQHDREMAFIAREVIERQQPPSSDQRLIMLSVPAAQSNGRAVVRRIQ